MKWVGHKIGTRAQVERQRRNSKLIWVGPNHLYLHGPKGEDNKIKWVRCNDQVGWPIPTPTRVYLIHSKKETPSAAFCFSWAHKKPFFFFWQVCMLQFHVIRTIFPLLFFKRPWMPKESWDKPTETPLWSPSHALCRGQNRETPKSHRLQSPLQWFVWSSFALVAMVVFGNDCSKTSGCSMSSRVCWALVILGREPATVFFGVSWGFSSQVFSWVVFVYVINTAAHSGTCS